MNQPMAALEKLRSLGLNNKEINNFLNAVTQGFHFYGPRELLRKLNLSENEIQDIEQRYAAQCEEDKQGDDAVMKAEAGDLLNDTVKTASASIQCQDECKDEDQDHSYGPGMGMG